MKVVIKYGDLTQEFENQANITIGNSPSCDIIVSELGDDEVLKLVYAQKYNNYVLMNVSQSRDILCNNKVFSKILVTPKFVITTKSTTLPIEVTVFTAVDAKNVSTLTASVAVPHAVQHSDEDMFDNDVEKNRIAIIKEIGFKILEFKNNIKSANITNFVLNVAMVILSVVSSFAITNFLLGLKVDNTSSVLNLTTNFGFLVCVTAIVIAICLILKQGVYSLLD